ncbi:unnamed protein product [Cercospora beticola]|nr:unnamed protein product [Cercospora beticola]
MKVFVKIFLLAMAVIVFATPVPEKENKEITSQPLEPADVEKCPTTGLPKCPVHDCPCSGHGT